MKSKTTISILLVVIFLGKFISVEANGLNLIFQNSNLTFVSSYCKKKSSVEKPDSVKFSQKDISSIKAIGMVGSCTSQYQIETFNWETYNDDIPSEFDNQYFSNLSYRYLDNDSPPPRLA